MSVVEVLRKAEAMGVELELKSPGKIKYRAHAPVPDELIEQLKAVKPELIKILQARQSLELDSTLAQKVERWGCERCSFLIGEEFFCEVQSSDCVHLVSILHLRDCPKRNVRIRQAIEYGDHLKWMELK